MSSNAFQNPDNVDLGLVNFFETFVTMAKG